MNWIFKKEFGACHLSFFLSKQHCLYSYIINCHGFLNRLYAFPLFFFTLKPTEENDSDAKIILISI